MEKINHIAILDDHELFRSGIEQIINTSPDFRVVESVSTPEELYWVLKNNKKIDIVLLDIRLKGANGLDVLKIIKEEYPLMKVIMLTMYDESSYIRKMIENGADGYLLKDITPDELFRTLTNVCSLGRYFNQSITQLIIQSLQDKVVKAKTGVEFTSVELEVLTLISNGYTSDEIAKMLYKSTRTIEGYRNSFLKKTNTKNIASLVTWAFKNGVL
ncbi:MAG: response regulator transcription factor [Saprospiraceae bacterium]|nr:response regulator transcription factor [Saprospiraceae bacterium]